MTDKTQSPGTQARRTHGGVRGSGLLGVDEQELALDLIRSGKSRAHVARAFGVTKNVMSGLWARHGNPVAKNTREPTTLRQRLDAIHARMDAVLAATNVPRIPNRPPETKTWVSPRSREAYRQWR